MLRPHSLIAALLVALIACPLQAQDVPAASPVVEGPWVRPAPVDGSAQPVWGHADGLHVGLHPLRGPRGLLRIYAPYLGHETERMINFIAVEPIPAGQSHRGLSELEFSKLDGRPGKRFWSADTPPGAAPLMSDRPARGEFVKVDGVDALRVYVGVERFENGAHVYVRLTFRADRPHEVGLAAFAHDDSTPLAHCVLTATMGNYARLRRLHLANDKTALSTQIWPDYRGDAFTPHAKFPLAQLPRNEAGDVVLSATPDEENPQDATHAPGTRKHWHYVGAIATQTWRAPDPDPKLEAWVNGRYTYWASRNPIPGGVSFENFELVAPFRQGTEYWFGVEPGVHSPSKPTPSRGNQP